MADQGVAEAVPELTVEEFRRRLQDVDYSVLLRAIIEYIYGLNDELVRRRIISTEQREKLDSLALLRTQTVIELLKILCDNEEWKKYDEFMDSLCDTHQEHVERFIQLGIIDRNDDVRPLDDFERGQFCRLRRLLVDAVAPEVGNILDYMIANNYISTEHKIFLDAEHVSIVKTRKLLDIVECRSFGHYKGFIGCLEINNPRFKLKYADIETSPAVVTVDSHVENLEQQATLLKAYETMPNEEFQDIILRLIAEVDEKDKSAKSKRTKHNIRVIGMAERCVRIYLSCCHTTSLDEIRVSFENGTLKSFLEQFYSKLIGEAVIVRHVFVVDICFQEFSLQCAMNSVNVTDMNSKHELLRNGRENMKKIFLKNPIRKAKERILFCAYMWRHASARKVSSRPASEAYSHLSSVCRDWWTTAKRLVFKTCLQKKKKQPDGRIELKREDAIQLQDRVICATQLNDAIYVVTSRETNALHQYSAKFRVYQDKFIVAENIQISSMEASETENGIFCIDETDGAVWLWTKGQQQGKATVMKQFSPTRCITVSPEDHMRILLLDKNNILEIHDQHSKIIQTLQLPNHIEKPLWLVRNKGGYILVSHGSNTGNRHRICMINRHGSVVLTYGCKRGNGPEELNRPCCMALDQEDRVFVADTSNHRVVVLDSKMNLINVVLDEKNDGINSPSSLHYVRDSKQLLVTRDKFVDIYKVKVIDGTSPDVPKV